MALATHRLALFAALLLLASSFGCTATGSSRSVWVMGWEGLVGLALLIVVLLLSIGYMAAVFMSDDRLKAWVVRELGQVFLSAVIIVAAVALVASLDSWMQVLSLASSDPGWHTYVKSLCCAPGSAGCAPTATSLARGRACHIEVATDYLQVLYETARHDASTYLSNYGWFAFLSNLSVSATLVLKFLAALSLKPFAGLELAAEFFSHLFDLAIKTMFLLRAQQIFLDFLWYPLFPVMLSMGLVLRIFYFTRKLGGMLIALSLSLYIVFPMFYVLCNAILWGFMTHATAGSYEHFGSTFNSDPNAGGIAMPGFTGTELAPQQRASSVFLQPSLDFDICNSATQSQNDAMGAAMDNIRGSMPSIEGGTWYSTILDFVSGAGRFSTNSAFGIGGPIANLALLMVFTLFLPFLALMTALAAFKAFSPLIGGDVEIQLLSKLI
jgi:hypothetical protein